MPIRTIRKPLDGVVAAASIALLAVMVAGIVWQVFSRYVLGTPSTTTDELSRFSFLWASLLGAAYAAGRGKHLALTLLQERLAPGPRTACLVVIQLMVIAFAVLVLIVGGWNLVERTIRLSQTSPALGLPMGWVYSVLPLSGGLVTLYGLLSLAELAASRRRDDGSAPPR